MLTEMTNQTDRLRRHLEAVQQIGQLIGATESLIELCRTVHGVLAELLDATGFILALYDEPSQLVTVVYQLDSGLELPGGSFPLGGGFTSQVIRNRTPRLIRNWTIEGPRVQIRYATDQRGLPESAVIIPLMRGDQVLGALSVQSYEQEAYDEDDLRIIQAVGGQMALAIQNLRVTERLDAQLQQRVSELEAIIENMSDALLIVDERGCIVRLNRAARELLCAHESSVFFGRPLDHEQWEQWPPEGRPVAEALTPIIEALQQGRALHDHEVPVYGQGRQVLNFSSAVLRNPDADPVGGVVVFRDVTTRHDVERLKDEVLSIASHDLRTPITVIKGHVQFLSRQYARQQVDPKRVERSLAAVERECDQMVEMLTLLLDFSRIESGRLSLQRASMDLSELALGIVEGIQLTTERHQVVLNTPPEVVGQWDRQRVTQILRNLVTNAVKYSPNGGTVEVSIEPDERYVTISIRDEGIGLASEDLAKIFERFYRTEGARRLEGSGLGLYICERIVTAHGGKIWAESAGVGRGTTFRFTLPKHSVTER